MTTPRPDSAPHSPNLPSLGVAAVFSRRLSRIAHLNKLLGADRIVLHPSPHQVPTIDAVVAWGEPRHNQDALHFAHKHQLPLLRVEDGFLRSVTPGPSESSPLSLIVDERGIYYNARTESQLEALLNYAGNDDPLVEPALTKRAQAAITQIVSARLSKYNDSLPDATDLAARSKGRRVLVVDQVCGDQSVHHGLADADSFTRMMEAAAQEHPDAELLVKPHPAAAGRGKRGYLERISQTERVRVLPRNTNPLAVIEQVDHVYVVTSQLGFEALMLNKPVSCFGVPFYAGWGLTDDRAFAPRRSRTRSLEQVFAAAYILYARYIDPDSAELCQLERVIEHLAVQRKHYAQNTGHIFCLGFHIWKRGYVRSYLRSPGNQVTFVRSAHHAEKLGFNGNAKLLVWGQRQREHVHALAHRHSVDVWRMEDGFLRSVGLGSDMVAPASLVVDRLGIYYDPSQPSELETILETHEFSPSELERAKALRSRIVSSGLSKYNVGSKTQLRIPANTRIILVPGQVEDDASIQLGCRDIRTNEALLQHARDSDSSAYVIYKPHPDVLSGNRRGQLTRERAQHFCDHVEENATLAECLTVAHEVHTLTSLVGFESLLRGLRVFVYGLPFYAGWGLTRDRHVVDRRTRTLTIDQLVAGTLIRYPRYLNRDGGWFTTPESVIAMLCREREANNEARTLHVSWPRRQFRRLVHAYRGLNRAS